MGGAKDTESTDIYYDQRYREGSRDERPARYAEQRSTLAALIERLAVPVAGTVLEIGAGAGHMHDLHPGYIGVEHSVEGVAQGQRRYGPGIRLIQGDAASLPFADNWIDFLFSYATLEHVPNVDAAFLEIARVLKPGGHAWLAPAWNCRPWTVAKLRELPYRELPVRQKIGKFLIPLREQLLVRTLQAMPGRLRREMRLAMGRSVSLEWRPLYPDFALIARIGHDSDDDAFVSMDAHAALTWFASQSWQILSHSTLAYRLFVRGSPILVRKPAYTQSAVS